MYGLYAWAALGCACLNLHSGLRLAGADLLLAFARAWPAAWQAMTRVESWGVAQVAVGAIATLAVMLRNYRVVRDTEQRRRIRWFIYGATAGTAPAGAMAVLMFLAPLTGRAALLDTPAFRWAMASAIAAAMLAPVSFAYASLKHDILDVRIVVGRGLQYLLARNVLRAALVLPVLPLAADVVRNPDRTLTQILLERPLYLALAAAGALSLRYRERLGRWVDRRFFREAYAAEGLLLALADEIGRRDSLPDLARLAGGQIESALHPRSVHLFLLDDAGAMGLGYSSDAGVEAPRIRPDSELPRLVEARAGALTLPVAGASLPAEDRAWLDRLGARLVVPVGGGERRLVGLLLLGEKRSEEAYGAQDRRLLEAVAGQIAVAYENAALERKLGEEARVKQEVLARLDARGVNLLKECPRCGTCYDRSAECCDRDGSALAPTLPVERTIEGKYRLERLLGRGGMGAVYQATDLRLGRDVAVKIMTGARLGDPDGLRRFEREARASARLRHPGIVTVHDYGRLGGEGAYLVMERLAGRTLRAELQDRGAVPPATAAGWFDQICEAVTAAHRAGVVHRDLKPENVFLAREEGAETQRGETVKILDFGLAKWTLPEGESRSLTAAGTVLGTLTYMSPEQLAGTPVDERTDVFAIGVMAFEAVTGRNPFRHDDSTRVVAAILHEAVALPAGPPERRELDDVLQRSLAKDREARIASVAGLQQLLIPALRRCPPLHTRAAPASDDEPTLERGE
jgi:GAF domain-containing protein